MNDKLIAYVKEIVEGQPHRYHKRKFLGRKNQLKLLYAVLQYYYQSYPEGFIGNRKNRLKLKTTEFFKWLFTKKNNLTPTFPEDISYAMYCVMVFGHASFISAESGRYGMIHYVDLTKEMSN
jgi:hypothetical protein